MVVRTIAGTVADTVAGTGVTGLVLLPALAMVGRPAKTPGEVYYLAAPSCHSHLSHTISSCDGPVFPSWSGSDLPKSRGK